MRREDDPVSDAIGALLPYFALRMSPRSVPSLLAPPSLRCVPLWTRRYYLNRAGRGIANSQWQRCAHDRRRAAGAWQLPARKIPPRSLKLARNKIMPHSSRGKRRGKVTAKTECNSFVTLSRLVVHIVGRQTDRQNLTGFSATEHAPRVATPLPRRPAA